jgi:NADH:ubiquinone oxidoreductase subunit 5 (subunit L)/multisubunit Na+/H+ antiporter MnhA subunit
MIPISLFISALFLAAGAWVGQNSSSRLARQRATQVSGVAVVASIVGLTLFTPHNEWSFVQPTLVSLVTLVAVALSSLSKNRPRTFSVILWISALTILMDVPMEPQSLALVWLAITSLTWSETKQHSAKAAALFGAYVGTSTLMVCCGLLLGAKGYLLVLIAIGLCIREACFPFQSWFLSFVEGVPMGLVVAFTAPQLGIIVHLRVLAHQLPEIYHHEVAILGVLTALFGAALATVQPKLKRMLAYLFISQSGLVAFGLESTSAIGHAGALASWVVVGLGGAGFAMVVEALETRNGEPVNLDTAQGNFEKTPILATTFLLTGMAMVGLPGSLGLVAEDLLVQGSVSEFPVLGFTLILVTALNAITIMKCLLRIFAGSPTATCSVDLELRERVAMSLLLAPLFLFGIFPNVILSWL